MKIALLATALLLAPTSVGALLPSRVLSPPALSHTKPRVAAAVVSAAGQQPTMMDDRIFGFNKFLIDAVYDVICLLYPVTGGPRDFARFYVLETVARVPYFAYLSVMHLRETFGSREPGDSERMRTHYAEADNELHHLLIMESLGGNSSVVDRTVAQTMGTLGQRPPHTSQPPCPWQTHRTLAGRISPRLWTLGAAFIYYWYVTVVYAVSEPAAYHLSELIEDHAFETYNGYLNDHEAKLKSMDVPDIARKYYERDNPFLFDQFCTVPEAGQQADAEGRCPMRRPALETLYDVFVNVRNDEREHWKTLCNLVQFDDMLGIEGRAVQSTEAAPPALEPAP